jgi:excinuclease ABC subunit A
MQNKIIVRGAREHNLKNIDVDIPRDQLVVITGLSGSGKSSLAFDTIFAEGQRRYVESLSAYARQFLGQMEKPDVDQIEGLSPAVSIDQKGVSANPRSTVGTVTEIFDYMRLLFARIGIPHCPVCGERVEAQSAEQIVDSVLKLPADRRIQVLAPVIKNRKGRHERVFEDIRKAGFVRVRVNGETLDVNDDIELDRYKNHTIDIVVDRLITRDFDDPESEDARAAETRLTDAVETALKHGDGVVIINDVTDRDNPSDMMFSEHLACVNGHGSLPELEPRTFSFNSPNGACEECQGLGVRMEFDVTLIVPNQDLSLADGAIRAPGWNSNDSYTVRWMLEAMEQLGVRTDVPWRELDEEEQNIVMYGSRKKPIRRIYTNQQGYTREYQGRWEGVGRTMERRYEETSSDYMRGQYESLMSGVTCPVCQGRRLRPEALAVTIAGKNIMEITGMPIKRLLPWVQSLRGTNADAPLLNELELRIAKQILKELESRVGFLVDVGLDYLSLSRSSGTLSGGEAQRIRLATQIGSRLTGVLYVLDEPTIGLHQRDNARLINTLEGMRDLGNTLLVVEHDDETIRRADWVIDLGPGAGEYGGEIVAQGSVKQLMKDKKSLTGAYLSGRKCVPVPEDRRAGNGEFIEIRGARENNLKNIDVQIPLGKLVCVTGVSGSGKSTLVIEILYKRLAQILHGSRNKPGDHEAIGGLEHIDKIINIDQSPIGRTPRSNPGTYTKMFDAIRSLFADLPESKVRGYTPGRFSFNVKGGRCENCQGQGQLLIAMQFLPDIYVPCDVCHGSRYNRETLQVRYKDKTIADVLDMTVSEAIEFFAHIPTIVNKLKTLMAVGLGYIRIGQPATTLSGGEAQRVKLSRELSKRATGATLYVLDEPSVGLHADDVSRLISVVQKLVDQGNTVVVIEHNPDIIKVADYLIDLGPEGGDGGGQIVAQGTPEAVAREDRSYTGRFLKQYLNGSR